jgi:ATP-dependent Clp protease ATP-binding subunit ClpB
VRANLKEQSTLLKSQWQNEKAAINAASVINGQIEQAKLDLEKAERTGDLNTAAKIKHGALPDLQKKLGGAEKALHDLESGSRLLTEEVAEDDIARIVASWTGIPVTRMLEGERQKLVKMGLQHACGHSLQHPAPRHSRGAFDFYSRFSRGYRRHHRQGSLRVRT